MRYKVLRCLTLLSLLPSPLALACAGTTAEQLQKKLQAEPVEQLVFFASWCLSCRIHLRPDLLKTSYFIAVFDEQKAADQAFKTVLGATNLSRCLWDQDGSIAEFYSVKSLPATRPMMGKNPR